jgi:hypothetical protein
MSSREVKRGTVLARVKAGDVPLGDAAQLLGVSYRQAKRLYARYRRDPHAAHQRARMQTAHDDSLVLRSPASMRLPANGSSRCSASKRRINARSAAGTGRGV